MKLMKINNLDIADFVDQIILCLKKNKEFYDAIESFPKKYYNKFENDLYDTIENYLLEYKK